jgi:hypothetical protein
MLNKRNAVAKDLRTPKYKMRVVPLAKLYNRKKENAKLLKELRYA